MPKGIDPKVYAARVTKAKKTVAAMDPAMKKKLEQYYPNISKADIAKQMLSPKTTLSDMEKRMKAKAKPKPTTPRFPTSTSAKKNMPKIEGAKPGVKKLMPKVISTPVVRKPKTSSTKKGGVIVALPNGSTVGLKDLGKIKPTPKPTPKPKALPTKSDSQYFNDQKKFIRSQKKR